MKVLKIGSVKPEPREWPVGQYMECLTCGAQLELENSDQTECITGNAEPDGSVIATCALCGGVAVGGDFRGTQGIDRNIQRPKCSSPEV